MHLLLYLPKNQELWHFRDPKSPSNHTTKIMTTVSVHMRRWLDFPQPIPPCQVTKNDHDTHSHLETPVSAEEVPIEEEKKGQIRKFNEWMLPHLLILQIWGLLIDHDN